MTERRFFILGDTENHWNIAFSFRPKTDTTKTVSVIPPVFLQKSAAMPYIFGHLILSFLYQQVEAEAASMMIEEDISAWPLLCIVAYGGGGGGGGG